jgi:hypothetical protein
VMERALSESVDIYTDYTGVGDGDEAAWVLQYNHELETEYKVCMIIEFWYWEERTLNGLTVLWKVSTHLGTFYNWWISKRNATYSGNCLKMPILWDVAPCNVVDVDWYFGGVLPRSLGHIYQLHGAVF